VPQGPQEFWVTYEYITDDVKVTYPNGGESFVPGETEIIRWDAYGNTGAFTIEYSEDLGTSWDTLAAAVPGTERYYSWLIPSTVTGHALIRLSRSGSRNISDARFNIINAPLNLVVNWRCPASFQLSWKPVPGATSYEAFLLGQKYMVQQGMTTDTSFWIQSPNAAVAWASVRAFAANGQVVSRRAVAISVPTATSACLTSVDNNIAHSPYAVSVFPNPMKDHTTISLNIEEDEEISITLVDLCGKEISSVAEAGKLSAGVHQFTLQNIHVSGMYMVMVKGENGVSYEKVIVTGI